MPTYYSLIDDQEIGFEVVHSHGKTVVRPAEQRDSRGVEVDFAPVHMNVDTGEGLYSLIVEGRSYQVHVERTEEGLRVSVWRQRFDVPVFTEREWRLMKVAPRQSHAGGHTVVKAPMPGLVKAVVVNEGDEVQRGQHLVVLEAMKMENDITAPSPGKVTQIHVAPGQTVDGGKPLVTLE